MGPLSSRPGAPERQLPFGGAILFAVSLALLAHAYLEGSYSELYPNISQDAEGMKKLFKQFSFPGGIPSHVAPETPGSIHEGGELGYALSHAYGAAFDNPDLLVACVIGDGEAETGPLAASWHSNKLLDHRRDGAVLPILHLNGYKIANPTVLDRIPESELVSLFEGYGWEPVVAPELARYLHVSIDHVLETQAVDHRPGTRGGPGEAAGVAQGDIDAVQHHRREEPPPFASHHALVAHLSARE